MFKCKWSETDGNGLCLDAGGLEKIENDQALNISGQHLVGKPTFRWTANTEATTRICKTWMYEYDVLIDAVNN